MSSIRKRKSPDSLSDDDEQPPPFAGAAVGAGVLPSHVEVNPADVDLQLEIPAVCLEEKLQQGLIQDAEAQQQALQAVYPTLSDEAKVLAYNRAQRMRSLSGQVYADTPASEIVDMVEFLHACWCQNDLSSCQLAQRNAIYFGEKEKRIHESLEAYNNVMVNICEVLENDTYMCSACNVDSARLILLRQKFKLVAFSYQYGHKALVITKLSTCGSPQKQAALRLRQLGEYFVDDEEEDMGSKEIDHVVAYYLNLCADRQFRKKDGELYIPVWTEDRRFYTYHYARHGEIENLIYDAVYPPSHHKKLISCLLNNNRHIGSTINWLTKCRDHRLPELKEQSGFFSFQNGVYDANELKFYSYQEDPLHPYHVSLLDENLTSCNYIDQKFEYSIYDRQMRMNNGLNPMLIETPTIEKVMDDQDFTLEVKKWMYVLLGRLFYPVGVHDNWQVFPFFKGVAGTGKSTLFRWITCLFRLQDIGVMANQGRRNFPIEHLLNKKVFFCFDLDSKMTLDQTLWNSMVTGEPVLIDQMYKKSRPEEWKIPGGFCGNTHPPWLDKGGSSGRRFVIFLFSVIIRNGDPKLFERGILELPALLFKATYIYRQFAMLYGTMGLWSNRAANIFPAYFRTTRTKMAAESNPVFGFLTDHSIVKGPKLHMSFQMFHIKFTDYANEWKLNISSIKKADMLEILNREQIVLRKLNDGFTDNHGYKEPYLEGIALRSDFYDQAEEMNLNPEQYGFSANRPDSNTQDADMPFI